MRQERLVTAVNGGVAAAIVAVLAAVALVVNPPAPPGIAEFAPKAAKPISKAPPGQAAGRVPGSGGCGAGARCPTPAPSGGLGAVPVPRPTSHVKGVPSALQCYAWPDGSVTQTFDSQSPSCVATWEDADKGNGGSTSRGVNAQTIRISTGYSLDPRLPDTQIALALTTFLNRHFQLYGRRLVLVSHDVPGTYGDPSSQRAAAAKAREVKAFASIYGDNSTLDSSLFMQGLARNHIVGVTAYTTATPSETMRRLSPYAWGYYSSLDVEMTEAGRFLCRAMAHRPASHSADSDTKGKTRSFAVLYPRPSSGPRIDTAPFRQQLARCGAAAPEVEYVGFPQGAQDRTGTVNSQTMLDLKQKGITTLVPVGSTLDVPYAMTGASRVGYHPEWFVVTAGDYGSSQYGLQAPPDQQNSIMGIGYWNKQLPFDQKLGVRAYKEVNPDPALDVAYSNQLESLYKSLLLIASGVQAAGPHLTPSSFAKGLTSLRFPNPEHGQAPRFQAHVGFGDVDRAMVDDFGLWYFLASEKSTDGAVAGAGGGYCWIERGRRYVGDSWPRKEPGFYARNASC